MDEIGVTAAVLPELAALRGIEQSRFHHLDVYDHTRAVLAETIALEARPGAVFGAERRGGAGAAGRAARQRADARRGAALRRPLLHDIAKPQTRA